MRPLTLLLFAMLSVPLVATPAFAQTTDSTETLALLPSYDDARFATATLYQNDTYRVVGFAFREGQTLPEHAAPVDAFFLVTEGRARVTVGGETHDLQAGEGVVLSKDVLHTVEAIEDMRALLVR